MDAEELFRRTLRQHLGRLVVETNASPPVEALQLLAEGLTVPQIAKRTGRSRSVVFKQLAGLRRAMGSKTNAHLVAAGCELGMIDTSRVAIAER